MSCLTVEAPRTGCIGVQTAPITPEDGASRMAFGERAWMLQYSMTAAPPAGHQGPSPGAGEQRGSCLTFSCSEMQLSHLLPRTHSCLRWHDLAGKLHQHNQNLLELLSNDSDCCLVVPGVRSISHSAECFEAKGRSWCNPVRHNIFSV